MAGGASESGRIDVTKEDGHARATGDVVVPVRSEVAAQFFRDGRRRLALRVPDHMQHERCAADGGFAGYGIVKHCCTVE